MLRDAQAVAVDAVVQALSGGALCLYDTFGVEMVRLPIGAIRDGEADGIRPVVASRAGMPLTYVAAASDGNVLFSGAVADALDVDRPLEIGGLVKVASLVVR